MKPATPEMVLPSRPHRSDWNDRYTFYDWEDVLQPDGRYIRFGFNSKQHELGWQFSTYVTKDGFQIIDGDPGSDFCMTIIENACPIEDSQLLPEPITHELAPGEILKGYRFGGVMSTRAGLFVVHESDHTKLLRFKNIWMS